MADTVRRKFPLEGEEYEAQKKSMPKIDGIRHYYETMTVGRAAYVLERIAKRQEAAADGQPRDSFTSVSLDVEEAAALLMDGRLKLPLNPVFMEYEAPPEIVAG